MKKMKKLSVLIMIIGLMGMSFSVNENEEKVIIIATSFGDMKFNLYNETPAHRDNFVKLVMDEYYNGTLFHRVIKDFMIQGGDPDSRGAAPGQNLGSGGPGYTIPAEIDHRFIHKKGALCAARQGDAANPTFASSGSQFYIVEGKVIDASTVLSMEQRRNSGLPEAEQWTYTDEQIHTYSTIGGTPHLDGTYTIFGEMTEGFDVLDAISVAQTNKLSRPNVDIPMEIMVVK
jgi:peptidyl-prolyl cis-trans isomerase B (cyclophilin B)